MKFWRPGKSLNFAMGLLQVITQNGVTSFKLLNTSVLNKMPRDYTAFLGGRGFASADAETFSASSVVMYSPCSIARIPYTIMNKSNKSGKKSAKQNKPLQSQSKADASDPL